MTRIDHYCLLRIMCLSPNQKGSKLWSICICRIWALQILFQLLQAAVERQALLEKKARRDRARQEMEELEEEETRLDIEQKKAMLESKRRAPRGDVALYGQHGVADYGHHEVAGYGQQGAVGGGGGGSIQRSQYYSNESYGDGYQDVRATVDHGAMVHAPAGRVRGHGVTSNRFGVEVQDLSLVGQQIYSSLNRQ